MKRTCFAAMCSALALVACKGGGPAAATSGAAPGTEDEKTFYALGLILGRNLASFSMTPQEIEFVKKGLSDQALNKPTDVKLDDYGPKVQNLARTRQLAKAEQEKKAGAAAVEKAAAEPGAQKLPSGVVVKMIKEGAGASPVATDKVKVHYTGTLENGTKFDSSRDRGQPVDFPLTTVVKCWAEGLQKMKVGGQAKLTCPSDTAYGDQGRPPNIPGGATLFFDVELISIEAPGAAVPAPGSGAITMPPKAAGSGSAKKK